MAGDLALWQTLDTELCSMVDHFSNLVKASRIPEEDAEQPTRELRDRRAPGDMLEIWAEKLVYSGYTALHIISQLKKGALVSDFDSLMKGIRSVRDNFNAEEATVNAKLAGMKQEVHTLLAEMETSYYSSMHKGKLVTGSVSEELKALASLAAEVPDKKKDRDDA